MITVVEYRDINMDYNIQAAFVGNDVNLAKEHFIAAFENSEEDSQYPYIAITLYEDDGRNYVGGDIFKTLEDVIEWWEDKCSN